MERAATPVSNPQAIQAMLQPLVAGSAEHRMRTTDHAVTLIRMFSDAKATDETRQLAVSMFDALNRAVAMPNPSPTARAWMQFNVAMLSNETERERMMVTLLRSPAWDSRILGLRLVQALPADRQKALAGRFAQSDPDALVRAYAASVVDTADLTAARPATQPTDAAGQPLPTDDPNATPTSPPP